MNPEDSVEITAPSVEEAILLGLTRLRATRDQVDIEVLEEGSKGFLGLGSHEAKVRLARRDVTIEPRVDLASLKAQEAKATEEKEEPQAPSPAPEKKPAPAPRPKREKVSEKAKVEERKQPKAQAPEEEKKPPLKQPEKAPAKPKKKPVTQEKRGGVDRDAVESVVLEVADHVFADFDVEVDPAWREEDRPTLWISLSGPDASSLVGRRARTLSSVQYVMRALVHHKIDGQYYLVVDADGYRERRHRSLRSLAERKANEAVQKQRTIRLRHMPASERRIIHMTLREDDRVETKSVGSGRHRAVTIIPD